MRESYKQLYMDLERFLRSMMTEDEEKAFLSRLENNPELKEQAQMQTMLIKAITAYGKEQQEKLLLDMGHSSNNKQ